MNWQYSFHTFKDIDTVFELYDDGFMSNRFHS